MKGVVKKMTGESFLSGKVLSLLSFVHVLQQPAKYSKQDRFRAWTRLIAILFSFTILISHLYSFIISWILALVFQICILVAQTFVMFLLIEYQDRTSDAAEVERLAVPLQEIQLGTRYVQTLHMLLLGEWWLALFFFFPQVPLDLYLRARNELYPDATVLWRHVKVLDRWAKGKLAYQGVVFVVMLVMMIIAMITSLVSSR